MRSVSSGERKPTRETDWETIFAALQLYKEQNGNVRVPSRFIVPEEKPWPNEMHGLRLGIRVASIRSTGRYVKDHPHRVQALENLGFEWQLRSSSNAPPATQWAGTKTKKSAKADAALTSASEEDANGSTASPAPKKRATKKSLASAPGTTTGSFLEDDGGATASAAAGRLENSVNGAASPSPPPPPPPTPAATTAAATAASSSASSSSSAFPSKRSPGRPTAASLSTSSTGDPAAVSFDSLITALREYGKQNPDFLKPPPPPPDPPKKRRRGGSSAAVHPGNSVPANFVIPDAPPWPISCRCLPLGMCLNQITTRGAYLNPAVIGPQLAQERRIPVSEVSSEEIASVVAEREGQLKEAGFAVKTQSKAEPQSMSKRFDRLVKALEIYSKEMGDLDVPQHYKVPEEAPWPEELWGLRLGSRVNAIRSQGTFVKNNPQRRELLTEMGFRWETEIGLRAKNFQIQRAAAATQLASQQLGPGAWQSRSWASDVNLNPEGGDPFADTAAANNPYYRVFADEEGNFPEGFDPAAAAAAAGALPSELNAHAFGDVMEALTLWKAEFGQFENIPEDLVVPFHTSGGGSGVGPGGGEEDEEGASEFAAMLGELAGGGGAGVLELAGVEAELAGLSQLSDNVASAASAAAAAASGAAAADAEEDEDALDIDTILSQRTSLAEETAAAAAAAAAAASSGGVDEEEEDGFDTFAGTVAEALSATSGGSGGGDPAGDTDASQAAAILESMLSTTTGAMAASAGSGSSSQSGVADILNVQEGADDEEEDEDDEQLLQQIAASAAAPGMGSLSSSSSAAAALGGGLDLWGFGDDDDAWFDPVAMSSAAQAAAQARALEEEAAREAAKERAAFNRRVASNIPWPAHLVGLPLGEIVALLRSGDAKGKYDFGGSGGADTRDAALAAVEGYKERGEAVDPWVRVIAEHPGASQWGGLRLTAAAAAAHEDSQGGAQGEGEGAVTAEGSRKGGGGGGGAVVGRRQKLDSVGFTWGQEETHLLFDFHTLVNALVVFMEIQGDLCVPTNFVVPQAKPWPSRLQGLPLGKMVNLARAQKAVLEAHYHDRFLLLTSMSFQWLPPMLHDEDEGAGGEAAEEAEARADVNKALLAAATAPAPQVDSEEARKAEGMKWATLFFEELCEPIEWVRLRTALETGFEWDEEGSATKSKRLFTLQDMYDVEAMHPEEDEEDEFEVDDFLEDDDEGEEMEVAATASDDEDDEDDDEDDDILGFLDEDDEDVVGEDNDDDDDEDDDDDDDLLDLALDDDEVTELLGGVDGDAEGDVEI